MKSLHHILFSLVTITLFGFDAGATETVIKPTWIPELAGCEASLSRIETKLSHQLQQRRARWGSAYLGHASEVSTQLRRVGLGRTLRHRMLDDFTNLLGEGRTDPGLAYLARLWRDLAERRELFVCLLSAECSLSIRGDNFLAFHVDHPEVAVAVPFPDMVDEVFALEVLGTFARYAAHHLHRDWTDSLSPHANHGRFDAFADRNHFDTVAQILFTAHQIAELRDAYHPSSRSERRRDVAHFTYRDLMERPIAFRKLVKELGITEANVMRIAREMTVEMLATVAGATNAPAATSNASVTQD